MIVLISYLFLALGISFLCSIMESVLLTTPQSYILVNKEQNKKWALKFFKHKENIDKPLSAILSLNTIAHTVGAAGVGAQAVKIFGNEYFALSSAILTILILVITEIIPKTIGAKYWKSLTNPISYLIQITIAVCYPLVIASGFITKIFRNREKQNTTSRDEIVALTNIGAKEGLFSSNETKIIQNILRLKALKVEEIMTPRVVISLAQENNSVEEFIKNESLLKFSRIPVYSKNEEDISGYVMRQEMLESIAKGENKRLIKEIKKEIIIIPNTMSLLSIWEKFLDKKEHIALVVDEYGGVDGIVTMEDIIESMLGLEIMDEDDTIVDMQKYARDRWKTKQAKYNFLNKQEE